MSQRIGIMGGTFDPPHIGHLVCAEEARCQFDLDKVIFMVAGEPALKDASGVTPAEDRYWMTCLATADNEHFEVSRLEIDRDGTTYTIDTLKILKQASASTFAASERGECLHSSPSASEDCAANDELFFITGADALFEIFDWKDADALTELATFIAATRPGYDLEEARALHSEKASGFSFEIMEVPALSISSSDLRRRFREGDCVRYLVTEEVERYVRERELYR